MKKSVTLTGTILKIDIRTTKLQAREEMRYDTLAGRLSGCSHDGKTRKDSNLKACEWHS
jgi:hypothetical protein